MEMDKTVELVLYGLVAMFAFGAIFFSVYAWSLAIPEKKDKKS